MVTLFKAPIPKTSGGSPVGSAKLGELSNSYSTKQDIDTSIPPKAKPVFNKVAVNGVIIAESDILHEAQHHPADNPGGALLAAARALVVRELLWQEAQRLDLDKIEALDRHKKKEPLVDQAINTLIAQEVTTPIPTEEDCRRIYEQSPEGFYSDTIWQVRHILLLSDPNNRDAYDATRKEAEALIENLKQDRGRFSEIAQQISACPSAKQGGNLGQLTRGSTVPEFEAVLKRAKHCGLLDAPIETRYGHHIVEIDNIIPGDRLPFEAVHEKISAWLQASSWSRAVAQYITMLASKATIDGIEVIANNGELVQ